VSFGKLFTLFVGDALAQLEEIDEIQLYFYKLNDNCGPASGINIAEFPIELPAFIKKYNDYCFQKRAQNVTIKEFLGLLISSQFTDIRSIGFGLRGFYEPFDPKNPDPKAKESLQKKLESEIAKRQLENGVFVYPSIQVLFETVHARSDDSTAPIDLLQVLEYMDAPGASKFNFAQQNSNGSYKRIMRVHVYDKSVDPYPLESRLLRDKKGTILEVPSTPEGKAFYEKLMDIYRQYGVGSSEASTKATQLVETTLTTSNKSGKLKVNAHNVQPANRTRNSLVELQDEISKRVPTIHYGANGTTITNASLSTKADSRVSTVNMIRPGDTGTSLSPNGSGFGGVPVRVIPATMSMTSLGCPLATPAQLFFTQFGTGTTIDNLMLVTNITHTLSPGKFETSWQFAYSDAYARYESPQTIGADFDNLEIK
jgi:hypothetical protein